MYSFFSRNGSIIILYDLRISNLTNNRTKLFELDEKLEKAATEWNVLVLNATVNMSRTNELVKSEILENIFFVFEP